MSRLTSLDFSKHNFKYTNKLLDFIEDGKEIILEASNHEKSSVMIDFKTNCETVKAFRQRIKDIQSSNADKETISQFIKENVFTSTDNRPIRYTQIYKGQFVDDNKNALGYELARITEIAVLESLYYSENEKDWLFEQSGLLRSGLSYWIPSIKKVRESILSQVEKFMKIDIQNVTAIHDSTDTQLAPLIKRVAKLLGFSSKHTYQPADVYLVKTYDLSHIVQEISDIASELEKSKVKDALAVNQKFYKMLTDGRLLPISLKQAFVNNNETEVATRNIPNDESSVTPLTELEVECLKISPSILTKQELGVFTFVLRNEVSSVMQYKAYPSRNPTTKSQLEVLNDGYKMGGRVGKVSRNDLNDIARCYNYALLEGYEYGKTFAEFGDSVRGSYYKTLLSDNARFEKWYTLYSKCWKYTSNRIIITPKERLLTRKEFYAMLESANSNLDLGNDLTARLQGLWLLNFFISNEDSLTVIYNKLLNSARKVEKNAMIYLLIA